MSMLIEATASYMKKIQEGEATGHDWFHTERVWRNAKLIAQGEEVDAELVELAALLHDLGDAKLHGGDDEVAPRLISAWLTSQGVSSSRIATILETVRNVSFKNTVEGDHQELNLETKVVQDADRLDALGAIGIARAFAFGGMQNRPIYDPNIAAKKPRNKEEYAAGRTTTINHFYDKLLLLKDRFNTETGRHLAKRRHQFLETFLEEFYREWNGDHRPGC